MTRRVKENENPYQSPMSSSRRVTGVVHSFPVGMEEIHTVFVESSFWGGLKSFSEDVAGVAGPVHRGPCQFAVGKYERHQVTIEVDGRARVNAFVDGKLVGASLNEPVRRSILIFVFAILFVGLLLGLFGYLGFDKFVDRWIESLF